MIKRFAEEESAGGTKNVFAEEALANLGVDTGQECPICMDMMDTPMVIPECMHQWCVRASQAVGVH